MVAAFTSAKNLMTTGSDTTFIPSSMMPTCRPGVQLLTRRGPAQMPSRLASERCTKREREASDDDAGTLTGRDHLVMFEAD